MRDGKQLRGRRSGTIVEVERERMVTSSIKPWRIRDENGRRNYFYEKLGGYFWLEVYGNHDVKNNLECRS